MDYESKLKFAVLQALIIHFEVTPIDIVCMTPPYQMALASIGRIINVLTDEQKGALYLEFDSINVHRDKILEILDKIEKLKKYEFINEDAIKAQEKKLHIAAFEATKTTVTRAPNLVNMLNDFCTEYVQKQMSGNDGDPNID